MKIIENLISRYCPDGVEYVDLGEVVVFTDGHSFSSGSFTESGEYQVVKITDIFGGLVNRGKTFINELPEKLKNGQQLSGGEILVAMSASTGKTGYNTLSNAVVNQRIAILRNQDCIENGYLKHLLVNGTFETYCFKNGTGPQNNISKAQLLRYRIPLPPLPIQQEIVRILDTFTNLTAELTAELTARRKQYEYYRDELLTFGEDVDYKTLPEISINCDRQRKPVTKGKRNSGSYPYYGASGIVDYVSDYIFEGDYLLISEDGANLLARSTPIAFSISGKNWVNNHAHVLKFETDVMRKYVEIYLNSIGLERYISGGAQPKLNQDNLNKIPIPVPENHRIQTIVDILTKFDKLCNDLGAGIPAEVSARQKQYEYYRGKLLRFS